jgi:hypothetical protein
LKRAVDGFFETGRHALDVNWPQLLQDYGPFALLPFALLAIERTAANRAHDVKLPETTRNRAYAAAWILIFLLCIAVVAFWAANRPRASEAMMRGRITGLGLSQRLRASGPEMANVRVFTYRDPQQTDQVFWRTFSASPLDEQTELDFLIDSSTESHEETWSYSFSPSRSYFDSPLEVRFSYDPSKNTVEFDNPPKGKPKMLLDGKKVTVLTELRRAPQPWAPWSTVVLAQSKPSVQAIAPNLESEDPLIRLTARKQLASLGPQATEYINKTLVDPASTYRVKLGVMVAANQMTGFRPETLSPAAWCTVWRSAEGGDDTAKTQANLLLKKQNAPVNASSCAALNRKDSPRKPARSKAVKR